MIRDPHRADYIRRRIEATLRARSEGADILGDMVWSLFDNFEWIQGYTRRFRMVHVYRDLIARHPQGGRGG
ncbi:family 1 glycosylhydrolase [Bauldia sp.]|uniref:family 1 glycosylhydrolase n=1 Tax=Bauldia sp. TaxID=2575872 RepID=UPI0025C6BC80|nr:family 1 glycosylhydrolase [Bauldia sp.]